MKEKIFLKILGIMLILCMLCVTIPIIIYVNIIMGIRLLIIGFIVIYLFITLCFNIVDLYENNIYY